MIWRRAFIGSFQLISGRSALDDFTTAYIWSVHITVFCTAVPSGTALRSSRASKWCSPCSSVLSLLGHQFFEKYKVRNVFSWSLGACAARALAQRLLLLARPAPRVPRPVVRAATAPSSTLIRPQEMGSAQSVSVSQPQQAVQEFIDAQDLSLLQKPIHFDKDRRVNNYVQCVNCITGCASSGFTCLFCPIGVCCPGLLFKDYGLTVRSEIGCVSRHRCCVLPHGQGMHHKRGLCDPPAAHAPWGARKASCVQSHAMPCHACMPCHAMPSHALPACGAMPYRKRPCHAMPWLHTAPCMHLLSCHACMHAEHLLPVSLLQAISTTVCAHAHASLP